MGSRYRGIIAVDVWVNSAEEAEEQVNDIVLGISNAFQISVERLPHGSEISLTDKDPA